MTKSRNDWFLTLIALLALGAELSLLLHQLRLCRLPFSLPWDLDQDERQVIGEISEKKHSVKSRGPQTLSWYPVTVGDKIHWNDMLLVGPEAWVRVKVTGEAELDLEADTLVRFSHPTQTPRNTALELELEQGILHVQAQANSITLKLKAREVRLTPHTEVVIAKSPLKKMAIVQVKKGEILVQGPEGPSQTKSPTVKRLKMGETGQLSADRGLAKLETTLLVDPTFPKRGDSLVAFGTIENIRFTWSGAPAAEIELDASDSFLSPKVLKGNGTSTEASLTPGRYFWRAKLEAAVSPTFDFVLMPHPTYHPVYPSDKEILNSDLKISLSWDEVEQANSYHVQLSSSSDFKEVLFEKEVSGLSVDVEGLTPGEYFWRVRAKHSSLGEWPLSPTYTFVIKKPVPIPDKKRKLKG
jgi:hypothetical protein